jgi:hypothetical protein
MMTFVVSAAVELSQEQPTFFAGNLVLSVGFRSIETWASTIAFATIMLQKAVFFI